MSALIFHTQPDMAIVATDTLAVEQGGSPSHWTTKALPVQHLNLIIAGTGLAGFSTRWFVQVNDQMLVRGVEHLDFHTPKGLKELFASYGVEVGAPPELTTTIYHLGISEETGEVAAFTYRSANDFQSERLSYGTKYKPQCDYELGDDLYDGLVEMMKSQRSLQSVKPAHDRVHIGGEIQLLRLDAHGISCARIHRFDDFSEQDAEMYRRMQCPPQ